MHDDRVLVEERIARLRELTTALVRHLHAFVRETALTDAEFRDATALLVRMGHLCDERHNEFVLMAGSLGVSALVCLLNHTDPATGIASHNLLGPFWRDHSPAVPPGGSLLRGPTAGTPMLIELRATWPDDPLVALHLERIDAGARDAGIDLRG